MLIPITRATFEQIIPQIATSYQYAYYWGKWTDLFKRLLISVVGIVVLLLLKKLLGEGSASLILLLQLIVGLYWFWSPVYWASLRNSSYRRFPYSGFWRGRILDVYVTEDIVSEEETVNKRGELVIVENRERRINIEIGDQTGFRAEIQAPLRRIHKVIAPGQIVELLVLSNQPDLATIAKITDVYIPRHNLWVGEYPYLQRDRFAQVSMELGGEVGDSSSNRPRYDAPRRRRLKN
jgi:hypothetical protein